MRGCFVFLFGIFLGVVLLAVAEVFVIRPAPPPLATLGSYDVRLLLPDEFLTHAVQSAAAAGGPLAPFRTMTVATQAGDSVILSTPLAVAGTGSTVPARIEVRPTANQNRVTLQVVRADLGSLPVPTTLFRNLEDTLNRQLAQTLGNASYKIVGISTTTEGVLVDLTLPK